MHFYVNSNFITSKKEKMSSYVSAYANKKVSSNSEFEYDMKFTSITKHCLNGFLKKRWSIFGFSRFLLYFDALSLLIVIVIAHCSLSLLIRTDSIRFIVDLTKQRHNSPSCLWNQRPPSVILPNQCKYEVKSCRR